MYSFYTTQPHLAISDLELDGTGAGYRWLHLIDKQVRAEWLSGPPGMESELSLI
jgi:hypothetical protein